MIVPRCWASPHSSFWQRHLYLLYFPWSQPAPEHFVTFSWRAISGSVQVEGGAKNVTLDGTFALEVTADRSSLLTKGNGTFMVQVYDLENAPFENGADRWEIDEFLGDNQGLVLAELELASEDSVFEHPAWLGEEVTGQPGYYNSFLARNPYKTWKQTTETKSKGDKTE